MAEDLKALVRIVAKTKRVDAKQNRETSVKKKESITAANTHFDKGRDYLEKKKWDKAIVEFTKAIELNPKSAEAYNKRGNVYVKKGDDVGNVVVKKLLGRKVGPKVLEQYDKAIADYDHAITLNPMAAEAYFNRGNVYSRKKQLDKATADYTQAITLNPKFSKAYLRRGLAHAATGGYGKAIVDYDISINLAPKEASAYLNRGDAYREQGNYDQAIADYTQVINLDSKLGFYGSARAWHDIQQTGT